MMGTNERKAFSSVPGNMVATSGKIKSIRIGVR